MSEDTAELVAGAYATFEEAVHHLIGIRPDTITRDDFTTEPIVLDSLYVELMDARHGERTGEAVRRPPAASRAPGWTDALSLLDRIDRRVQLWWPETPWEPAEQPLTVRRLYALVDHSWRPQDVGELRHMTRELDAWVDRIKTLMPTEEVHTWELRAPCPSCGETTTQVDDGNGELVRRYVLQADKSSAKCSACETSWSPDHYRMLAMVIGASLPDGVLE